MGAPRVPGGTETQGGMSAARIPKGIEAHKEVISIDACGVWAGVEINAELLRISFTLHVSCVGMLSNAFLLAGFIHFEEECWRADAH